jgi:hypothetical protein
MGAVIGTLLLAGCSSEAPSVGALGDLPNNARLCTPISRHGDTFSTALDGTQILHNSGNSAVTIRKVTMAHAQRVKVAGSQLAPIMKDSRGDTQLIGIVAGPRDEWSRKVMAAAHPAVGAKIGPQQSVFLIVDLAFQPGHGAASGPERVVYTDSNGTKHLWTGGQTYLFTVKESCNQ